MGRTRVTMNQAAYDEYRNDPTVVAVLQDTADTIRERAQANVEASFRRPFASPGEDIRVDVVHNRTRAVAFVATATLKARVAEHTARALNRAIGG